MAWDWSKKHADEDEMVRRKLLLAKSLLPMADTHIIIGNDNVMR